MRIDFSTGDGYEAAKERFLLMCGGVKEGAQAFERIKEQIRMRADIRVFENCVSGATLTLADARIPCSALGALSGIKKVYAYVLTAGDITLSGTTLERTLEDMWGTAFTDACCELLRDRIVSENPEFYVSNPFGPGFYGIKTEEIPTIFNLLDGESIGLSLKNGMISPIKSSIGFFLVSDKEITLPSADCESCSGDTACEYCKNRAPRTVRITFKNENISVFAPLGTTVLEAARRAGVIIESPCGGLGKCGKCAGKIIIDGEEKTVLLCSERARSDMEVITRRNYGKISVESVNTIEEGEYALAADIGTTTLEAELLRGGKTVQRAKALNPQAAYAADVIRRIQLAENDNTLRRVIINAINGMIEKLCNHAEIEPQDITSCALTGNTVMQYIIAGKNPHDLGQYPYTANERFGKNTSADTLGLKISGSVYFPPVISAFVGGDAVCGALASNISEKDKTLFIDIGTNGEMIMSQNGTLTAASAAAGPAFEGTEIRFGMRSQSGAISRFKIVNRNTVSVETIDKAAALGICGSGLIDAVGELVKNGIITKSGNFADKRLITSPIRNRLCDFEGGTAFKICGGIYLTQSDIRKVQLAKSAIRAGIEILGREAENIIIAGAFGTHTSAESLISCGIIPEKFKSRVKFAGNAALEGAKLLMYDKRLRETAKAVAENTKTVSLSENSEFERMFVKYMDFAD